MALALTFRDLNKRDFKKEKPLRGDEAAFGDQEGFNQVSHPKFNRQVWWNLNDNDYLGTATAVLSKPGFVKWLLPSAREAADKNKTPRM